MTPVFIGRNVVMLTSKDDFDKFDGFDENIMEELIIKVVQLYQQQHLRHYQAKLILDLAKERLNMLPLIKVED